MKRHILAALLAGALLFSLAACSNSSDTSGAGSQTASSPAASSVEDVSAASSVDVSEEDVEIIVPDPIVYTGSGDDVIELDYMEGVWVLEIAGNAGANHFSVKGYDEQGGYTELFVNTTDPYQGITFDPYFTTTMLEISATGDWSVTMKSAYDLRYALGGETISGSTDEVFLIYEYGKTADIVGNADSHHFSVKTYGDYSDLAVNTTDPYSGTVMLRDNPVLVAVNAECDWSIALSTP